MCPVLVDHLVRAQILSVSEHLGSCLVLDQVAFVALPGLCWRIHHPQQEVQEASVPSDGVGLYSSSYILYESVIGVHILQLATL